MFLPTSLINSLEHDARQWKSILQTPPTQLPIKPIQCWLVIQILQEIHSIWGSQNLLN